MLAIEEHERRFVSPEEYQAIRRRLMSPTPRIAAAIAHPAPAPQPESGEAADSETPAAAVSYEPFQAHDDPERITIDFIKRCAAERAGAPVSYLFGINRYDDMVLIRSQAAWYARKLTTRSLARIGREMGGRDHSTISHAIKKIEAQIAADPTARPDWLEPYIERLRVLRADRAAANQTAQAA